MSATVTLAGNPITITGTFLSAGDSAPDFILAAQDLSNKTLADYAGKRKVLTIIPSLDTPVCAKSTKIFHDELAKKNNVILLAISADLPFAGKRFCGADDINVETLSTFRSEFAKNYGVAIADGKLQGLTTRAVLVLDENNVVIYSQLVNELTNEPDYSAVLAVL